MTNTNLKDGYRYEDDSEGVIFNHYSFCEIVKHIMVKYGNLTYDFAQEKLKHSFLIEVPSSKDDVEFLGKELKFHWAMLTAFGEMYWTKGIPSDFNEFKNEYLEWESEIRLKRNLKEPFEYYDITINKN